MGVGMGVGEPPGLFFIVLEYPIEFSPRSTDREGSMKIDQDIRLGDDLPHGFDVGVLLRDVAAGVTVFFKACNECGFPRAAWADNTDQ